ncbi:GH92 family glycosyl hydrolase [Niabella insulamsoli]|uniref:GH92 family glycosyl hydrolase n=1 Tax=Niabella insulamsoli TaxID=3144874 RepID=UPI0031FD7289
MIFFKRIFFYGLSLMALTANAQQPLDYVNPLMGTLSKFELSNGNTYPAIGLPWGMNLWTPQTGRMGDGWAYKYSDDKIVGFKQTHQPSPWMNDYGYFSIMPITGKMRFKEQDRASWFSHKAEVAQPHYYKVYLADADVTTEIAPTERAARFRFTFPQTDSAFVVIDAIDRGSYVKIIPEENKIIGYSTRNSGSVPEDFKSYFVIEFDKPFDYKSTWDEDKFSNKEEMKSKHAGAVIGFKGLKRGDIVNAKVASSFISFDQAELNLKSEIGNKDFDAVKTGGAKEWSKVLGRVKVSGGTDEQLRTFYSCLYRMVFFPLRMYEKDAGGNIVHYSPYTGKAEPGYKFAGTGFWDTFRALYPFLHFVYPAIAKEMQQGLISDFKEGGWLPEWSSPGYRGIMVGNNSASVVAEAYLKGLRGYDIETLWQALVHGANNEGPHATGRRGVSYYNRLGYVPNDVKISENVARSLEYAYDDYAIYAFGKAIGKPSLETDVYKKRAMNYKKLFDPQHLLMRPKNEDGSFSTPFNPYSWGGAFTEGNSWHYSWSVFQDIEGLKQLMGGNDMFVRMLDSVFIMPPDFGDYSYYGSVIHEMREMQITNMGQYAHGNQPIQHMTYLYNYAGQPWKSQYWVREVMDRLYNASPDGYCGDEDNGQTSAWYVFSALGFYPVTPASTQYVLGVPLFKKAEINFENGKKLVINAPENSAQNRYVKSVTMNGKSIGKNFLDHFELLKGGALNFALSAQPNKTRGVAASDYPFSMSTE